MNSLPTSAEYGYIYIMSCGSLPNAYKVGCAADPALRARQLSASTSIPTPFTVVYSRHVRYPFQVEAALHRALDDYRLNDAREFFNTSLRHIIELAEQYEELPDRRAQVDLGIDRELPFSWLFSSFPDNGPRELDEKEQALCRDLARRLHTGESVH